MKDLRRDMQIMENFEQIYTQKIEDTTAVADLSRSQIKALFAFNGGQGFSMKDLAESLNIKISRMNIIADRLIKDGIAEYTQTKDKINGTIVRLTPQGKNIRDQIAANRYKLAETIYARLSDKDKVKLIDSLDTAFKILNKIH
jgi:DNA-binding MarR family transcriptional regulator